MSKLEEAPKPASPKKAKKKKHEDWEVEGAFNDLVRAEKHKEDPELMSKVHALAGRHMKAIKGIKSVEDLREVRNQMAKKGEKPEV